MPFWFYTIWIGYLGLLITAKKKGRGWCGVWIGRSSNVCNRDWNSRWETEVPVNPVAAVMILADKADVRCSRVRNTNDIKFDIHDKVNFSVKKSSLKVNEENTFVKLKLYFYGKNDFMQKYQELFFCFKMGRAFSWIPC